MMDEEWLKSVTFKTRWGRVSGMLAKGSEHVVFNHEDEDGEKTVLKTYHHHLAYHIREIPPFLSDGPQYDVERVNRKLLRLVGNPDIDLLAADYDRLWSSAVRVLYAKGSNLDDGAIEVLSAFLPMLGMGITPSMPEAFHFLLATPMMSRRLQEISELTPHSKDDPRSYFVKVNGPNFPIDAIRQDLIRWGKAMFDVQQNIIPNAPFAPAKLAENPVVIWGLAAMEEFFTDDEIPAVVAFVEKQFGRLPSSGQAGTLSEQVFAMAELFACCLKDSRVDRLVKLAGALGFMFDVYNRDGQIVASSMREIGKATSGG